MTSHLGKDESPLVVHVIPSALGRGAQRAARVLVDRLDEPGVVHHRLLGLFDGPSDVDVDLTLGYAAGDRPGKGFDPRLALKLRTFLARLNPSAVVAHGGDAMKYLLPAVIWHQVCIGLLRHRDLRRTTNAVPRMAMEAHHGASGRSSLPSAMRCFDECTGRFRVAQAKQFSSPTDEIHPNSTPGRSSGETAEATLIFVGALTPQKQPDRFVDVVRRLRA